MEEFKINVNEESVEYTAETILEVYEEKEVWELINFLSNGVLKRRKKREPKL